ncbi:MAG: hypothetical protein J5858_04695 [Lentisphaeria bacterium]|nr:hypothetical protein [Lentisphaeria bacterium]
MKILSCNRLMTVAVAAGLTVCAAACTTQPQPPTSTASAAVKQFPLQNRFFLPKHIYAVPGLECNIYFRNIFLAVNPANYVFDVSCKFGRNDLKRWRFTPVKEDGGKSFPLKIQVFDQNGLCAEGTTTVHVAPADAGKGRDISILVIGDSLTNATVYPTRLHQLCQGADNPKLSMIGTHRGSGRKPLPGGVAHEGYGGWTWQAFLNRYQDESKLKNPTPIKKFYAKSKFLTLKNGKPAFDLASYLKKNNNGKTPDVITFQLGVNDVFSASEENLDKRIQSILNNADNLIAAFRKEAPDALIGVGFVTPGANQDAFGKSYKCGQTSWGYYRNHFRLNQAMAKHFANSKDKKLVMIPTNVNLDTENNFPTQKEPVNSQNKIEFPLQSNGVHPAPAGYNQIGDTFYAWLKNQLAKSETK